MKHSLTVRKIETESACRFYSVFHGNIVNSRSKAVVNPVNIVGVHGKGVAYVLFAKFPEATKKYYQVCRNRTLRIGTVDDAVIDCNRHMVFFPSKEHWRNPSKMSYIEEGLIALRTWVEEKKIDSIAIPAIGCGEGGLDWKIVKSLIIQSLKELDCSVFIYEPYIKGQTWA